MAENSVQASVNVDPVSRDVVLSVISTLFSDVAVLDNDTLLENLGKLTEGGFSRNDRGIRVELADYLLHNAAYIYVGLLVNDGFRGSFMDAIATEIALEGKDADLIKEARENMKGNFPKPEAKGYFVFDFSSYSDEMFKTISGKIYQSFATIESYDKAMSKVIEELDDDYKLQVGFCISNFAYMIRAFCKNRTFCHYATEMIDIVRDELLG